MATNGIVLLTPSSVAVTGSGSETATINSGGSVTFSACGSLSLNGVFSSTYDNYVIDLRYVGTGNQENLSFRLRSSGSDATGTNYVRQALVTNSTTVSAGRNTYDSGYFGLNDSEQRSGLTGYFYGPALAQPTAARSVSATGDGGARTWDEAVTHSLSTAYDGITFLTTGAGVTFTGLVKVYGLVQ